MFPKYLNDFTCSVILLYITILVLIGSCPLTFQRGVTSAGRHSENITCRGVTSTGRHAARSH